MRSIFNATLRFGLVAIPVGLVPARVDRGSGFSTLHRECGMPVNRKPWCPEHERVLEPEELVSGFEVAPGEFVPIEEAELAAVAPVASNTIAIECLVDAGRLDPIRVEKTYYLKPAESAIGRKPYVLLSALLTRQNRVALARLVYRGAEWVVAVGPHPSRSVLLLHRLAFSEELVDPLDIESSLRGVEVQDRELEAGDALCAKLWVTKPSPKLFQSEHQARVRQVLDAKLAGGAIVAPGRADAEAEAPTLPAVDLTEQLRASLRRGRTRQKSQARTGARARKG